MYQHTPLPFDGGKVSERRGGIRGGGCGCVRGVRVCIKGGKVFRGEEGLEGGF